MSKVIIGMTISLDGFARESDPSVSQVKTDSTAWKDTAIGQEMISILGQW
jgi:hypothetical protein